MKNTIDLAIIPIAGKATRLYPITKVISKSMLPILNKPVIQYILDEIIDANIKEVIIVVNKEQEDIKKYLNLLSTYYKDKVIIHYVTQENPYGVGDAILQCRNIIRDRDFALLLGDDVILKTDENKYGIGYLIEKFRQYNKCVIGLQEIKIEDAHKYGITKVNEQNIITQLIEKPQYNPPSNYALIGRYIFTNNFIKYLEELSFDEESEIKITTAINNMIIDENIYGFTFNGTRYDTGNILDYIITNIEFALKDEKLNIKMKEYIKKELYEKFI